MTILVAAALGLAGNLASSTVQVSAPWWPWAVWLACGLLVAATVLIELRRSRSDEQDAPRGARGLDEAAAQLARAVRAQWRREEELWRVHDPFPLPVRWHLADGGLADHWANIRRAQSGEDRGSLALAGRLNQIASVYRRISSGRLVVLGRAGAGKTVLAVRFVLDMLGDRADADPVPVIFGLGSWDPSAISLRDWLARQLVLDHPALASVGAGGQSLAVALIAADRVLPVLDGFDEIAGELRTAALLALNAVVDMPLVLTSRADEYVAAVDASDVLSAAAVIELDDLTLPDMTDYLARTTRRSVRAGRDAAGPPVTRWDPVIACLRDQHADHAPQALRQVLASPLMLTLARAIYSDTPKRDPAELLDTGRFATAQALEDHLLAAFTLSVYNRPPGDRTSARPARRGPGFSHAQSWLSYIAWHLSQADTRDLALWQIGDTIPRPVAGLAAGTVGVPWFVLSDMIGLSVTFSLLAAALLYGLLYGIVGGLSYAYGSRQAPSRAELRFRGTAMPFTRRFAAGLGVGTAFGLGIGLPASGALITGLAAGLALGSYTWLHTPVTVAAVPTPLSVLRKDRTAALILALAVGLALGTPDMIAVMNPAAFAALAHSPLRIAVSILTSLAAGATAGGLTYGRAGALAFGIVVCIDPILSSLLPSTFPASPGIGIGLLVGVTYGLGIALAAVLSRAWGRYTASRILLALRGDLPWRLMSFLEDAHHRGVLRQSGGIYQFRHVRLHDHLSQSYHPRRRRLRGGQ